jgi:hypothetical protein
LCGDIFYKSLKEYKELADAITAKQDLTELEQSAKVAMTDYESRKRLANALLRVSAPTPTPKRARTNA